ncbi:hypothetical protein [Solimonas flava]|uniref:hypothetical protein n=1 Tax=Solimonas flava TaxID=415849 RepID=UPI0004862051|nr:hypothetical protein [Solimonas flava]
MNTKLQALPAPRLAPRTTRRPPALTIAVSIGNALPPSDADLDRRYIRLLLENFCAEADGYRRSGLMRAAIDLYDQLVERSEASLAIPPPQAMAIDGLIDLLECTPPTGRLYYSRGLELARALRSELDRQDTLAGQREPAAVDDARSALRRRTMARAQSLLAPANAAV